jgi:hypothetical protein
MPEYRTSVLIGIQKRGDSKSAGACSMDVGFAQSVSASSEQLYAVVLIATVHPV